jgi:hypothetical protein
MQPKLSPMQAKVFNLFDHYDKDIEIARVFRVAYDKDPLLGYRLQHMTVRDMQQLLGPLIKRINDKLQGGQIVPGHLKQTYRIIKKGS